MNAIQIARAAVSDTETAAKYVSAEVRDLLAIGKAAVIVDGMDDSTPAAIKIHRLQESIREIRNTLHP